MESCRNRARRYHSHGEKDGSLDQVNNPGDYIFPTSTRGQEHKTGNLPMSYWNADHIFSLALKNAGLAMKDDHGRDTIHIHCLRKFFFTQMLQPLGRDIAEALMGHKLFLDSAYRRYTEDLVDVILSQVV